MGRHRENALSYFPMDTDTFQDIKIRKLIKYQGGKAFTVYALLLCLIYKNGYYMRWDEELPFIISEQTGFDEAYIREVIKSCLALGLFSLQLYDEEGVLTSRGIQERYSSIVKTSRRSCAICEYNLISSEEKPISSEEKPITSEEKPITSETIPQRKEKGNIKKTLSDESVKEKPVAAAAATTPHKGKSLEERKGEFYNGIAAYVGRYPPDMLREFFDYWSETNRSRTKMRYELERTWELSRRLATWANRDGKYNKPNTNQNGNYNTSRQPRAGENYAERAGRLYAELEQPLVDRYGLDTDG